MYRIPPSSTPPFALHQTDGKDFFFQEAEAGNLRDYWIVIRKYCWTIMV
jgi:hypothetical protein